MQTLLPLDFLETTSPQSTISPQSIKMFAALAEIGMSKDSIAALLEVFNPLPVEQMRFFKGPIVQHRSLWMDITPDWLYAAIPAERLTIILEEQASEKHGWQVGPAEITAVILPASMEAPLQSEYAELYFWATVQATARHRRQSPEDYWQMIGHPVICDDEITSPSGRLYHVYQHLCSDIRSKVVKAQQERSRTPRTRQTIPATIAETTSVQFDLFDSLS